MIKHKFWTIIMAGLLISSGITAQEVSVKATLDSVMMLIGHQSKLTLEITQPANVDIAFPLVLDTLVDKVEVLSRTDIDTTIVNDERLHLTQEFLVTSFDSGFYYIPPFEFEIQASSGGGVLQTNPLVLKMFTYQIDSIGGVYNIKPVKKIKYTFKEFLPYLMWWVIISLVILSGIAAYWRFKKKKPLFTPKARPQEPPYITAFRELERIRNEKLWQSGKEKEYFTDLTDTLRGYIEGRYEVLAMEQTSDEILSDIKDIVEKEDFKKIDEILRLADLVKFAKMKPMLDESEKCLKQVYAFVDKTKRVMIEEDEAEEKDSETMDTEERAANS